MTETHPRVETASGPRTISRRRVVVGAAWTVPLIAVATAAPAYAAASGPLDVQVTPICNLVGVGGNTRGFRVNVLNGTLPSGSTFVLTAQDVTLEAIGVVVRLGITASAVSFSDASLVKAAALGGSGNNARIQLTTQAPIASPGGFDVRLNDSLLNLALLTRFTLTFQDTNNLDATPGNDSGSFNNTISAGVAGIGVCVPI